MKKIIFFVLSTIFVLIIPNTVDAATFHQFQNNYLSWSGSSTTITTWFSSSPTVSNFNGFATFNFTVEGLANPLEGYGVPYEVRVVSSEGVSICSMSSVSLVETGSVSTDSKLIISALCPLSISNGNLLYLRMYRGSQNPTDTHITLPTGLMLYSNAETTAITNAINDVNTSINNDSVSTNTENSSTASGWASNNASDSVVSDMVLMPITLLNAFSTGFSGSCQAYNLGSLYGTNLTLPCINLQNYFGATLWGIIDVLMSGFLIYGIGKKFVRVFNDFTNLKDSQVDELYGGGNE